MFFKNFAPLKSISSWIIIIVYWCFWQSESSLKVNGVHHAESNPKREEWKTRRRKRIGENSSFKKRTLFSDCNWLTDSSKQAIVEQNSLWSCIIHKSHFPFFHFWIWLCMMHTIHFQRRFILSRASMNNYNHPAGYAFYTLQICSMPKI